LTQVLDEHATAAGQLVHVIGRDPAPLVMDDSFDQDAQQGSLDVLVDDDLATDPAPESP
jgi:hypothetical protein